MDNVEIPGLTGKGERVMSIMAHPDDAEIFCAGTLIRLQEKGFEAHIVSMTPGDCGSAEISASEIAEVRRKEGAQAAAKIRASYSCLDYRDLRIHYEPKTLESVVEMIRRVDPSIVFTHPPRDYMADHEQTSLLVRAACFAAPAPNYDTQRRPAQPPTQHIPHLYYSSPASGTDIFGKPAELSVLIDVTDVMGLKTDMLACHESQREWLRRQHGMDEYLDEMKRWGAELGKRASVEYAEGFTQHVGHPYPGEDRLAELLD